MAKTGGVVEVFPSGAPAFTRTAAAAITAGTLVEVVATGTVQMAGATSIKVCGVALEGTDFVGTADKIAIKSGGVFLLTASGAVTAGDKLITDSSGRVKTLPAVGGAWSAADITNTRAIIGIALDSIADTAKGRVLLQTVGG
jgi:hypothetical protein